jgi:DNA-binding NtrC family response regulator
MTLTGSHILVADDEPSIREVLRDILEGEGAQVTLVGSGSAARNAIEAEEPDLAIFDVRMPAPDGLELLREVRSKGLGLPILIITAQDSSTIAIDAMQRGAYDYLSKPFDIDEVLIVVRRAIEHRRLTRRVYQLERATQSDPRDLMIGRSQVMQQVYKLIGRVAASTATVLITGESGTGKELVAQVIHRSSERRDGPFVAVNCAALPETLLESELFGHEKGAFTGAVAQRKGRFELAAKGTIFLDEIGETSLTTQKKLLRVLQERCFERVGGNLPVKVDVRFIAATNRDLLHEASLGHFREDLYYRLNVINIHMPPLRERRDDIVLLVDHFLSKHRRPGSTPMRIAETAIQLLQSYDWPGNVRQLENTIERAIVLAQGQLIGPEHIQIGETTAQDQALHEALTRLVHRGEGLHTIMSDLRQRLIAIALESRRGDRGAAARLLKIPESEVEG